MGYSVNPDLVPARAALVKELAAGRPATWRCEPDLQVTQRLINKIRETLYIASQFPSRFPDLARAHATFMIRKVANGHVEAIPKIQVGEVVLENYAGAQIAQHGITDGPLKPVPRVGMNAQGCINSWNKAQPSNDPLIVYTDLELPELIKLHAWATNHEPKLMLLVGEGHVTISLYDMGVATIAAWNPPEQYQPDEEFDI